MTVRTLILLLSIASPLSSQVLGVGYQVARSDQTDTRQAQGPGFRIQPSAIVELRYDYVTADGERLGSVCGFEPPDCPAEPFNYSSRLHNIFIAARARLVSFGSFELLLLPEFGMVSATLVRRSVATGRESTSDSGILPGGGAALQLSVSRVGGSVFGGWIAARARVFAHPGEPAADAPDPYGQMNWIRSLELGVSVALRGTMSK
jgi:hypothetical protein